MEDQLTQEEEIMALRSIYEEEDMFSFDTEQNSGTFYVKITASESIFFNLKFENGEKDLKVKHLPPIQIDFKFPSDYPSKNPPEFVLSCRWLQYSDIVRLCKNLDDLWEQNGNQSVLFTWISFLTDEIFEFLNLIKFGAIVIKNEEPDKECDTDKRTVKLPGSSLLFKNFDNDQIDLEFKKKYFTCQVCFTDKMGKDCMKFHKCDHVFCSECMKGYFESQINSGDIKKLICPFIKCETEALQTQVLALVGIDLFNRYDSLLLKDSLNSMSDIVYCPRTNCQSPVIPEDTLAQCNRPGCHYVFCALCRQGYHGIEPCKITTSELREIYEQYTSGGWEVKEALNKKFGEKRIRAAIEEFTSMEYIKETSKQCPNCKSWMQKLDGCNKMVCSKCTCYFCWLCSKILSRNDPYSHFNQTQSSCFEKLFEGAWSNNGDENNNNNNDQENADSNSDDDDHELPRLEHLDLEEGDFIYEDDAEDDGIIFRH